MSTLFAFLHHLAAFTLVAALAMSLTLIRQELTRARARRLQVTDILLGISAGLSLIVGLCRVFFFKKGADYYFHKPCIPGEVLDLHRRRVVVGDSERRVSVLEQAAAGRAGA
jgi:uncharacterized membrane protein